MRLYFLFRRWFESGLGMELDRPAERPDGPSAPNGEMKLVDLTGDDLAKDASDAPMQGKEPAMVDTEGGQGCHLGLLKDSDQQLDDASTRTQPKSRHWLPPCRV